MSNSKKRTKSVFKDILTEDEVAHLTQALSEVMKEDFPGIDKFDLDLESAIRFRALSEKCEGARPYITQ